LLTLLLFLAVALSLVSGSLLLIAITLTVLMVKLYPALLVLVVAACGAFFLIQYLKR
jgi:hypothetical protein